jgi:alpha-L-arabinofuranosidase
LTVVNPHVSESRDVEITVRGASIRSGSSTTLANSDIHAHNTFEHRYVVVPRTAPVESKGRVLNYIFPPASVTKLALTLA